MAECVQPKITVFKLDGTIPVSPEALEVFWSEFSNNPIEVVQWTGKNINEMLEFVGTAVHDIYQVSEEAYSIMINTPAGKTKVSIGDYIIKYYEPVEDKK